MNKQEKIDELLNQAAAGAKKLNIRDSVEKLIEIVRLMNADLNHKVDLIEEEMPQAMKEIVNQYANSEELADNKVEFVEPIKPIVKKSKVAKTDKPTTKKAATDATSSVSKRGRPRSPTN